MDYKTAILRNSIYDVNCGDYGTFKVKLLKGGQVLAWETECFDAEGNAKPDSKWREKFVAMSLCDENGTRLFTDNDLDILATQVDAKLLSALYVTSRKLNLVDFNAVDTAKKN